MMNQRKNLANIITSFRIIFSIVLIFCPALSAVFFAFYLAAGLTDMIDGPVARRTGTASRSGSVLDTLADFVFVSVCFIKIIPAVRPPLWVYISAAAILLIKVINALASYRICRRFSAVHSVMNKITGVLLFILPLTLPVIDIKYSAAAVCPVAAFSALQEGYFIINRRE